MTEVFTASEVAKSDLVRNHANRMQRGPKISLPNGQVTSASPYIGVHYATDMQNRFLSEPESILKSPKPGCKYVWRVRTEPRTSALIRSQVLRPVEMSEIVLDDPTAEITKFESSLGEFVTWESMALFEMQPQYVFKYYGLSEEMAKSRLAAQAVQLQDTIEEATQGHMTGAMSITQVPKGAA